MGESSTSIQIPERASAHELQPVPDSRFGAALYNPFLWAGERLGMAQRRRRLLANARERVLEIGAGSGLNLRHYPDTIDELVLAEPSEAMAARIDASRAPARVPVSIAEARAEALPFRDDSFDTVVSTLVLCTVDDPQLAVAEVARVLRPGGRLLFCEHVHAEPGLLHRWQNRLAKPWAAFAAGCRCNRATLGTIAEHLEVTSVERDRWRGMPALVKPLVIGEAVPR